VVAIDEFPYLLAHSPELPTVLQRWIDESRGSGPAVRLVICGSALSVMASLLAGSQALRGRASHDLPLRAFDYRTAARFWGIEQPAVAFRVHAVLGGTPGYRDLVPATPPARLGDFDRWLEQGVLNPASRDNRGVQHPLEALEDTGFVVRDDDILRNRRPIHRLADPIVRFHHVVTRRHLARFEDHRFSEAWADAQPRFAAHVLGPHFEQLAREFAFRFASPVTLGGTEVIAIGEAKHTNRARTTSDLTRLEQIRALLAERDRSPESLVPSPGRAGQAPQRSEYKPGRNQQGSRRRRPRDRNWPRPGSSGSPCERCRRRRLSPGWAGPGG
jgi:hypothetical protein